MTGLNTEEFVEDFLEHYGVKGMRWGVRNEDSGGFRLQGHTPQMDKSVHSSNLAGAKEVAGLMNARYGFQITAIKDLKINNQQEYDYGTVGFVEMTPGKKGGTIFIKPEDNRKPLADAEKSGWFAPGTGNVRAFVTHESGHAMFHAEQEWKNTGFLGLGGKKVIGGNIEARETALIAAGKQALRDGIPPNETIGRVSGYAKAAGNREELEAELFSQYHWGTNRPEFVKVWGETLHRELGVDATPFRETVKRG